MKAEDWALSIPKGLLLRTPFVKNVSRLLIV